MRYWKAELMKNRTHARKNKNGSNKIMISLGRRVAEPKSHEWRVLWSCLLRRVNHEWIIISEYILIKYRSVMYVKTERMKSEDGCYPISVSLKHFRILFLEFYTRINRNYKWAYLLQRTISCQQCLTACEYPLKSDMF